MLYITVEGGVVTSVTIDNPLLKNQLNGEGVVVVDYDIGSFPDYDDLVSVVFDDYEEKANGHMMKVEMTKIRKINWKVID